MNCERQGEKCDYSIRLNWEGRTKRKATERTPEPKSHLPTMKLENSPGPEAVKFQQESVGSSPPTPFGKAPETTLHDPKGEVDKVIHVTAKTKVDPVKTPPPAPLTPLACKAQGDDGSRCPPSGSQEATSPFPSCTIPRGSKRNETASLTSQPNIQVLQNTMLPPHQVDPHADAWSSGDTSPTRIMAGSFGESRPAKKLRSDPPSALDISFQNSVHGYYTFPNAAKFPQAFHSSTGSTRYSSIDSTMELPPIHSMSLAMSSFSDDTSTERSSRSSAWLLPPILENPSHTHRLSVNALLSSPTTTEFGNQTKVYGIDKGFPDLDIPRNKDNSALDGTTPLSNSDSFSDASVNNDENPLAEFGFGLNGKTVLPSGGGFYASPVPVVLERNLEPLPPVLLDNQMNLLYFHHFINHTARILVPHDCLENPFGTILPQSEIRDATSPTDNVPLRLTYCSGRQRSESYASATCILCLSPRTSAKASRTHQPHRHLGPRRLPVHS